MNEYIVVPVAIAAILGMLTELEDLTKDAQERTLQYAQDATAALDCAYQARPITDCAPGITNPDFTQEIERTNKLLQESRKHRTSLSEQTIQSDDLTQ